MHWCLVKMLKHFEIIIITDSCRELEVFILTYIYFHSLYDLYSFQVIPVLGEVIAGDWKAYQYLVESIRCFLTQVRKYCITSQIRKSGINIWSSKIPLLHFRRNWRSWWKMWAFWRWNIETWVQASWPFTLASSCDLQKKHFLIVQMSSKQINETISLKNQYLKPQSSFLVHFLKEKSQLYIFKVSLHPVQHWHNGLLNLLELGA